MKMRIHQNDREVFSRRVSRETYANFKGKWMQTRMCDKVDAEMSSMIASLSEPQSIRTAKKGLKSIERQSRSQALRK